MAERRSTAAANSLTMSAGGPHGVHEADALPDEVAGHGPRARVASADAVLNRIVDDDRTAGGVRIR
jgi:hypothetical protein